MSEPVHRIYYEIVGDGLPIAKAHYAKISEVSAEGMKLAERFGAAGFRPGHSAGILHLIFDGASSDVPPGFKYAKTEPGRRIACTPHKGTAIGKAASAELQTFPHMPNDQDLASALGYHVASMPMDGWKIYYPAAYRFLFPTERYFLDIPRQSGDGWEPPAHLQEVPASTFMLAMEAHNAEAKRLAAEEREAA